MGGLDLSTLFATSAMVFVAAILRGFTGFGFALAATPLLALLLPPAQVVPTVLLLQVGSSLIGLRKTLEHQDRASTWRIGVAACIATPFGVALLGIIPADLARVIIALVSLAGIASLRAGFRLDREPNRRLAMATGLIAGLLGGLCAMSGPPVIAYFLSRPTPSIQARASMILIFLMTGIIGLLTGATTGLFTMAIGVEAALLAPSMIVGTWLGSSLFTRAPDSLFRKAAFAALGLIALMSLVAALR
ncbi:TSUP family transporter [Novosphingobium lindaniclasticum]|uniref:Probable membrane transporter protein n=1 Tax=Novosphingobium lindaniclasticum LE124 TaxID=1096930 RepID=T0HY80_9SPHN|nr:TSUP family transporter [Novosphingobium lindaniclasticum]EQB17038.1 hypothetical protein L284_08750 [Novosphingobium lindaniclasticum LE124]